MRAYILLLIGVWAGLVLGLSFVEAPLKFQAPGISTKLGLGIGRLVFSYSNKIQLIFLFLLLGFSFLKYNQLQPIIKISTIILLFVMAIQGFYLLPILDARATQIMNDIEVPKSKLHLYFVVLEILKMFTLISLFLNLTKQWKT